ncbi:MAG TPA: zf-HC2 domain-containing protein [Luteibacter sp.]|uniref:anti-sigma factor family protein n=1 Tax=Luteibacter sp. TaxID=1886636 RepID=UPI002BC0EAA9|nr:zf-HC2 domain-containing protein [Luteibacter sp.]HVI56239.1 zf-HC2 domain-containing protein [Luteibacter sp.]
MDCKAANDMLPLYFDGELDRATGREFEAHLDECADCRAALIELDALRGSLRNDAPRYRAPDALRARIQKEMAVPVARRPSRMRVPGLALAASWMLAFVAGGLTLTAWNHASRPADDRSQLTRDLFASHWRALAATSPIDVVSTDQHTVKPWFAGKIATAPVVQDYSTQGYALIGGRIDYVGTERVPVLVYRHGKHLIDVFVLPPTAVRGSIEPARIQGYVLEGATLGGQPAAIVSDMDEAELDRFRVLVGASNHAD